MKNILAFCFAIAWLAAFTACECKKVDCANEEHVFFQFLSIADSTDLIVNGNFALTSLSISQSLINQSKSGGTIGITPSGDGYIASVSAHENVDSYIIQLGSLKPDTLKITTKLGEGDKCCRGILEFETLLLNGVFLPNDFANPTIQLYK